MVSPIFVQFDNILFVYGEVDGKRVWLSTFLRSMIIFNVYFLRYVIGDSNRKIKILHNKMWTWIFLAEQFRPHRNFREYPMRTRRRNGEGGVRCCTTAIFHLPPSLKTLSSIPVPCLPLAEHELSTCQVRKDIKSTSVVSVLSCADASLK